MSSSDDTTVQSAERGAADPALVRLPSPTLSEVELSMPSSSPEDHGPVEAEHDENSEARGQSLPPEIAEGSTQLSSDNANQRDEPHTRTRSRSSSPEPTRGAQRERIQVQPPITSRIRRALGLATPKSSLAWRLTFNLTQIVSISVLLGLSSRPGSALPIPNEVDGFARVAGRSQWETCSRPLGAWDTVWAVKALLGMGMAVWEYWRAVRPSLEQLLSRERRQLRAEAGRMTRHRFPPVRDSITGERRTSSPIVWTRGAAREEDLDMIDAVQNATAGGGTRVVQTVQRMADIRMRRDREQRWYSRCTSLQALYAFIWFVVANILLYGSLGTCRYTSPLVWWLTFALLCLGYIVVAEMIVVALAVFVIGPMIYLTINIILVCMGRHPLQPGGRMGHINPDVPKMPRAMVDRIPLVMYIPVPVREEPKDPVPTTEQVEHVYPPPVPTLKPDSPVRVRRKFFFFRRKKIVPKEIKVKGEQEADIEAGWEKNEYPFVKLEANRAACAICLMDFEPPKRISQEGEQREGIDQEADGSGQAEPLRLLACGHVFHRECLDPWLVDVSGRCPTCQRPVEEDDLEPEQGGEKKQKKRRFRRM